MSYRTDRQRVDGLGSAKEGVGHWWAQRISSIALVPLTLLFLFPFVSHLGGDYAAVRAAYAHPFNAIVALLLIITVFAHLKQGLQVVIEDYIHDKPMLGVLQLLNTLFCWAMGLIGVFAVARIAFAG